jgi:hypothetical protein
MSGAEADSGSELGLFIGEQMKLGVIVPQQITIGVLQKGSSAKKNHFI